MYLCRDTSLIRKCPLLRPCSRPMPGNLHVRYGLRGPLQVTSKNFPQLACPNLLMKHARSQVAGEGTVHVIKCHENETLSPDVD